MTIDRSQQQAISLTAEQVLQQAIACHQAGRLPDAERLYRAILRSHPNHPNANHNLGVIAVQTGKPAASLAHFNVALAANPNQGQFWLNCIDALMRTGRIEAAEPKNQTSVALDMPLTSAPTPQEINSVVKLFSEGRYTEAMNLAHATLFTGNAAAHFNLGNTLLGLERPDEAMACYQQALQIKPDYADAHNNLGYTFRKLGRLPEAEASCRQALRINPNCAEAHNNLGITLGEQGRADAAEMSYRRALQIKPDYIEAYNNLGMTLNELGRADDAEASYQRALQLKPDCAEAHYNRGIFLLLSGKFAEGWQEYEHRWEGSLPRWPRPTPPLPQWTGQPPLFGDELLIFGEQGFGDRLQFSRFLPLAAERFSGGVSCIVEQPLQSLFRRSFPRIKILDAAPVDQRGWQCPLLSLPLAFGATLETIPKQIPYLIPDPARVSYWKSRIDALGLPTSTRKIGVVWKSGGGMKNAARRSLSLQQLGPLLTQPKCIWFSLQKEPDLDKTAWVNSGKLIDWADEFGDFDETAALSMNLDLIISVDTSVVHLAGALGRPTWLFNRHASEWRWMRDREDSPWYPTLRIFTQKTTGDWDEVVTRMCDKLCEWEC